MLLLGSDAAARCADVKLACDAERDGRPVEVAAAVGAAHPRQPDLHLRWRKRRVCSGLWEDVFKFKLSPGLRIGIENSVFKVGLGLLHRSGQIFSRQLHLILFGQEAWAWIGSGK